MFAPQDGTTLGTTRKVFQKPNILRRKPKAKRGAQKCSELVEDKNRIIGPQIIGNKPLSPAKLYFARVADYPLLAHGAKSTATTIDESEQPPDVPQLSNFTSLFKEKALGVVCSTVQNLTTTNEYAEPSIEIPYISQKLSEETPNLFLQKEFSTNKSTLFGEQVEFTEGEQSSLNIESFLVDSPTKQSAVVSNDLSILTAKNLETDVENKWCLNFMSDDSKDMVTPNFYDGGQINICKDTDISSNLKPYSNETNFLQQTSNVSDQEVIIQSCLNSRVVKFKCDVPNCNKSFWNEARLQKHKTIHNRQKTSSTPALVECPVKNENSDGVEQPCGKFFPSRDLLGKHLNEDHVPEDAAYKCPRCGRHFWWATGMRTHAQSICTRALVCTWSGCGRVFRQPCRLREHARAHTGDRPYPCNYPNCGWAFRSASKLVRHSRRHTGERRHECAVCGRAFLRREHLRDHAARYHAPHRDKRSCTHPGCEQSFANMSSLYMHMKRVHQVESDKPVPPKKPPAPKKPAMPKKSLSPKTPVSPKKVLAPKKAAASKKPKTPKPKKDIEAANMLVMSLDGGSLIRYDIGSPTYGSMADVIETANASAMIIPQEELVEEHFTAVHEAVNNEVGEERVDERRVAQWVFTYDLEGRCARTHCTWPLQRTQQEQPVFTIEEDTQVEQSEGSESNIYTVRSDLFLHGNVLINEDSEFIIRESSNRAASEAEETSNTGQLDGLDLIDEHPTIDLMQEELMYADAAVDESSFRVFMLNGEELS